MITPATVHLPVRREVPFIFTFRLLGVDLTGYTLRSEWLNEREVDGAASVTLINATSPDEGLSITTGTDSSVTYTDIEYRVDQSTIEGVLPFTVTSGSPNRVPPGALVTLYYDIRAEKADAADLKLRKFTPYEGEVRITAGRTKDA